MILGTDMNIGVALLFVLVILIACLAATPFLAKGKAYSIGDTFPGVTAPSLVIQSPNGRAIYVNGVPLNLTLAGGSVGDLAWFFMPGYVFSIDGGPNVTTSENMILTGLPRGQHRVDVYPSYYVAWGQIAGPYPLPPQWVTFNVMTSIPQVSILKPESKTYNVTSLPLTFTVEEIPEGLPISQRSLIYNANANSSWLAYSLDGQANTTILGNTTLTELSEGEHSIIVYANNTNGNMGTSEYLRFDVSTKTREEPTPLTASLPLLVAVFSVVAVVAAAAVVYVKKRKR